MNLPIRLLVTDIDGTLLNPEFRISEVDRCALQAAHQRGIQIVLATGRRHDYALPVAQELGIPVWMISSNGALIRSSSGETFFFDQLPAATAGKLIQYMDAFRGHAVLTFDRPAKGALVLERADKLHHSISRWIQHNSSYIQYVIPLEDALTEDPIQAMYCGAVALMESAQDRLNRADFLNEMTILRTQYDARDLCIVDILNRDCSKGHALRRLAEHHGIPREQIMAIGDNYNDLEMLEFAGFPVIMGNASEDLKQNGWKVTKSNAENGVAEALQMVLRC